jgi:RNA polymerase sigma-70 factor, ECF subfamily
MTWHWWVARSILGVPLNRKTGMTLEDAELIDRLVRRERPAVERVVRAHHGFLVGMVMPLVGVELAEDVVQEAWIKAFAALGRFEGRASLRTWLAQIALNTARSRRRAQGREVSLEEWGQDQGSPVGDRFAEDGHWRDPPGSWHHTTPDELLTEDELRECIEKHLQRLPADQQTVLRLREFESMEFDEIGAITELSEGNVRVLLHRARQKLHAMINHFEKVGTC